MPELVQAYMTSHVHGMQQSMLHMMTAQHAAEAFISFGTYKSQTGIDLLAASTGKLDAVG